VSDEQFPLPEGAVLVHIGPYKTGTTAIQTSLGMHREDMARNDVLYPGRHHRQFREGWALLGKGPLGVGEVPSHEWDEMVAEVRASDAKRVCISTEDLASAGAAKAQRVVEDLGRDRVHVAIVVRRLDKLLPSAWQQRVKSSNEARTYEEWLREVLAEETPTSGPGNTFWHNHGVARLLSRWRDAVPPEQVTLIVADESDRTQLARTFERLLDLPDELLTPGPRDNTSLSLDKIELNRLVNKAFDERGWDDTHRRKLIHRGMLNGLRRANAHETDVPIPSLPKWAAERVAQLSDDRVDEVVSAGARVIGDPESLRYAVSDDAGDMPPLPETIRLETAAYAVEALVEAALDREAAARRSGVREGRKLAGARRGPPVDEVSSREMLREIARRQRARMSRRFDRVTVSRRSR
jgi:hypothetical protein